MSLVLGLLQAVTTENMYSVLFPAKKPVLEEYGLRSLLCDNWQEINQQEGEQEKGYNGTCDIHSFGFQCSRKGFMTRGKLFAKTSDPKKYFFQVLSLTNSRYAIVCVPDLLHLKG